MIDSLGNTVSADIRDKLAECLGEFERVHGFMLEGRLTIGTAVVWFQHAPTIDPLEYMKAPEPAVYNIINEVSSLSPAQRHEIEAIIQTAFNRMAAR